MNLQVRLKAFLQRLIDLIQSLWLRNLRWWVGLGGHSKHSAGSAGLPADTWSAEHREVPVLLVVGVDSSEALAPSDGSGGEASGRANGQRHGGESSGWTPSISAVHGSCGG